MAPRQVTRMVYLESVLLIGLGLALGLALGLPITLYYRDRGLDFGLEESLTARYGMSSVIHPQPDAVALGWAAGIVLVISLAVAVYPAVKAARVRPMEALRRS